MDIQTWVKLNVGHTEHTGDRPMDIQTWVKLNVGCTEHTGDRPMDIHMSVYPSVCHLYVLYILH
jgi:hypothetical protein